MQLIHLPKRLKEHRRLWRLEQRLSQLAEDALPGKRRQIHRPAEGDGLAGHSEAEASRELRRAQHPERILREALRADVAQNARLQIRQTAKGIDDLPGQHVLHHCVDGEVPALRGLEDAQKGIGVNFKILVAPAGRRLQTRHGDVQLVVPQAVDAEARAHLRALPEAVQNGAKRLRRHAVNLDVDVLAFPAQQPVAHQTAHIVDAAPLPGDLCGNPSGHVPVFVLHDAASFPASQHVPAVRKSIPHFGKKGNSPLAPCSPIGGFSPPENRARPEKKQKFPQFPLTN